jgi:hypothetical protein
MNTIPHPYIHASGARRAANKTKPAKALRGTALARATLVQIFEHPETWEQWDGVAFTGPLDHTPENPGCGCFMHHAAVFGRVTIPANCKTKIVAIKQATREALGITRAQFASIYFSPADLVGKRCRDIFGIHRVKLSNGKIVTL